MHVSGKNILKNKKMKLNKNDCKEEVVGITNLALLIGITICVIVAIIQVIFRIL